MVMSVFSAPANNMAYKIAHFQFQGGLVNNRTQVFILVQAPSLGGNSPTSSVMILIKTGVISGEQSARLVHVLKGVLISCLLHEG
jgi:hypothetical protein